MDEPWRDDLAASVDGALPRRGREIAYCGDLSVANADAGLVPRGSSDVDMAVGDDEVEGWRLCAQKAGTGYDR